MRKLLLFFTVTFIVQLSYSQSIRKDYREFTQQEMNDYVAAINILYSNGTMLDLANHHSTHFNSIIHTTAGFNGEQFLTWHRFNMLDFETLLRSTNANYSYLALPFWDWTTDQSTSATKFWNNDFLAVSKFPTSGVSRSVASGGFLGSVTDINNALNLTTHYLNSTAKSSTVTDFLHRLEYYHDFTHVWVGGTMAGGTSPRDPIFYLHHNFIDNLWQQWEDKNSGNQSSATLTGQANLIFNYYHTGSPAPVSGAVLDSRSIPRPQSAGIGRNMDVWFAKSGKVILDGANGTAFIANDITTPYLYRYTAATTTGANTITGQMYVGDVKYDAINTVLADNKGGFQINSGVVCDFKAGKTVVFMPGFIAKSGSKVSAKIITAPNTARNNNSQNLIADNSTTSIKEQNAIKIYSNPTNGIFKISLDNILAGTFQITNMLGSTIYTNDFKNQNELEVNIENQPAGIYIVTVVSGDQKFVEKVIKN
jgi:tyrosinase